MNVSPETVIPIQREAEPSSRKGIKGWNKYELRRSTMSDHNHNDECLELLDAMEIGFTLSDYQAVESEQTDVSAS